MQRVVHPDKRLQLTINAGRQTDGYVYELDSRSRQVLADRFPRLNPVPGVFVSNQRGADPGRLQKSVWPHVAEMLTGLTGSVPQEMDDLQLEVHIFSPKEKEELGTVDLPVARRRATRAAAHG